MPQISASIHIPFLANTGQCHQDVAYCGEIPAGRIFVTGTGAIVYTLAIPAGAGETVGWSIREVPVDAQPHPPEGVHASGIVVSRYLGADPSNWRSHEPAFHAVSLGEVYPGIEIVLESRCGNVEKIFSVSPGACPEDIRMRVLGADRLRVNEDGALVVETASGAVSFTKPSAYQEGEGGAEPVPAGYVLHGDTYGFKVGPHDRTRTLIIDPLLASTFIGGSGDEGTWGGPNVLLDETGCVYIAGYTSSMDFPTTPGAYDGTHNGSDDICICKLDPDLTTLLAATFMGGSGKDWGFRGVILALADDGDVYVAGETASNDFPTTLGTYDTSHNGGNDVFVARLTGDLSTLAASTFLGGSSDEWPNSMALDDQGNLFLGGQTTSTQFPTTPNAFDKTYAGTSQPWGGDIFISRFDGGLKTLAASTYLGGAAAEFGGFLSLAGNGTVFVTGTTCSVDFPTTPGVYSENHYPINGGYGCDMYLTRLDPLLTKLEASSFLGGSLDDWAYAPLALDGKGNVYVTGHVSSTDYPTTAGAYDTTYNGVSGIDVGDDVPVTMLDDDFTAVTASTFVGGKYFDAGVSLHLNSDGDLYVAGMTKSADFPTAADAYSKKHHGGQRDAFAFRLDAGLGTLKASTFLGGSQNDTGYALALSGDGTIYIGGITRSADFPTTCCAYDRTFNGGTFYSGDLFVSKLDGQLSADTLKADTGMIPAGTGGAVHFNLQGGTGNANRKYLLLGSSSGISPGLPLPGGQAVLPLNWDFFTGLTLAYSNTPVFTDFTGNLDGAGSGSAVLDLGPLPAGAIGLNLYFAYTLNPPYDFASNPVGVEIVP